LAHLRVAQWGILLVHLKVARRGIPLSDVVVLVLALVFFVAWLFERLFDGLACLLV
jgi:hypothetical protein